MTKTHAERAEALVSLLAELELSDARWWIDRVSVPTLDLPSRFEDLQRFGVVSLDRKSMHYYYHPCSRSADAEREVERYVRELDGVIFAVLDLDNERPMTLRVTAELL